MAIRLYCRECNEETLHGGPRDQCLKCKSKAYKAAKAIASEPCKLMKLEEDIYDIRKSLC